MFPFWLEFEPATLMELATLIVVGIATLFTGGIMRGSGV